MDKLSISSAYSHHDYHHHQLGTNVAPIMKLHLSLTVLVRDQRNIEASGQTQNPMAKSTSLRVS